MDNENIERRKPVGCFLYPELPATKVKILRFCWDSKTTRQIVDFTNLSVTRVRTILAELQREGYIVRDGGTANNINVTFISATAKRTIEPKYRFKKPKGIRVMGVWMGANK